MKKLKSLLFACALLCVLAIPALAGEIPIGGFCDSAECVQQNQAEDGGVWVQLGESLWVVGSIY